MLAAARTLGAGPARTFARVALPLAAGGLGAGAALSFARGIGEFGATIMFAGSLQGVTQTLSLAIYAQFDVDFTRALAIGAPAGRSSARLSSSPSRWCLRGAARPRPRRPLRSFELALALAVERRDARARRALGRGEDDRAPRGRAGWSARDAAAIVLDGETPASTPIAGSTCRPSGAASGSSSRSTRSSRTCRSRRTSPSAAAAARRRAAGAVPDRAPREGAAGRALRRRAPAGRARARAGTRPRRAPARRADGRARRAHAGRRAGRAAGVAPRARAADRCSSRTTSRTRPRSPTAWG